MLLTVEIKSLYIVPSANNTDLYYKSVDDSVSDTDSGTPDSSDRVLSVPNVDAQVSVGVPCDCSLNSVPGHYEQLYIGNAISSL